VIAAHGHVPMFWEFDRTSHVCKNLKATGFGTIDCDLYLATNEHGKELKELLKNNAVVFQAHLREGKFVALHALRLLND